MINTLIKGLMSILNAIGSFFLSLLPTIPSYPETVVTIMNTILTYINAGLGIVYNFIPKSLVIVLLPLVLVIINFEKVLTAIKFIKGLISV